ncbi:MAG: S26 family signal peptidase [Bacteroidaceae bacterium]
MANFIRSCLNHFQPSSSVSTMLKVVLCVLLIVLLRVFVTEFYMVNTPSMMPTIQPTEVFMVDKCSGGTVLPHRFADIPVVNVFTWVKTLRERDAKRDWGMHHSHGPRTYRPGDIILFQMQDDGGDILIKRIDHVVQDIDETYYYVLGDNRENSTDSRSFGLVPEHRVVGRALFVVFSWDSQERLFRRFRWSRMFHNLMIPI